MFIKVLKHSPRKSSKNLPVEKKDEGRRVPERSFFSPCFPAVLSASHYALTRRPFQTVCEMSPGMPSLYCHFF